MLSLALIAAVCICSLPLLVLVHELGHAVAVVLRLPTRPTILVGRQPPLLSFAIGRIDFRLHPYLRRNEIGLCRWTGSRSRLDVALIALGGPVASVAAGLVMHLWASATDTYVLSMVADVSLLLGVVSLVPSPVGKQPSLPNGSDGSLLLSALRGTYEQVRWPTAEAALHARLDETLLRYSAVAKDKTIVTSQFAERLLVGVRSIGIGRPATPEEATKLQRLAASGWWWRAAEHGDPTPLYPGLLAADALIHPHEQVPEHVRPALVAWRFLAGGGRPALGSPGETEAEKGRFVYAAYSKFHGLLDVPADIHENVTLTAFFYGMALHDAEGLEAASADAA